MLILFTFNINYQKENMVLAYSNSQLRQIGQIKSLCLVAINITS